MPKREGFLILDACVLIDYVDADASVLGTVSRHVAPIAVVRPVFDEVDQLDEALAASLRLRIVNVELDIASEAARTQGPLSFQDRLCLIVAQRERWTCVTNDKALRAACSAENVSVIWGLEMMVRAVHAGAMSAKDALAVAQAISAQNPRYVTKALVKACRHRSRWRPLPPESPGAQRPRPACREEARGAHDRRRSRHA